MKAKIQPIEILPAYKPFELVITIESAEEAADLYAVFNHTQIMATCRNIAAHEIRESITDGHGGEPSYLPTHHKLCKLL